MIEPILAHLERLVAFDTRNPPRAITREGIFGYVAAQLPGFDLTLADHGAGSVSLLAVRGTPRTVFNVHLDTVPSAQGWTCDPHTLRRAGDRVHGLGTCDTKGAAAALIDVAQRTSGPLALLFTSDEEANDARGVAAFLREQCGRFAQAVIAEPTGCRARVAHRGIVSATARFRGVAGHASEARALEDSAIHRAVAWSAKALGYVRAFRAERFDTLAGMPFNLGRIEGGIKGNVIAPDCELRFNFRPLPGQDVDALLALFRGMAPASELTGIEETFRGPPLPAKSADAQAGRMLAQTLGLPTGAAVDFWTEASLFSAAGMTALVFGPGDIAQAHAVDEWVALDDLATAARHYEEIFVHGRA